MEIDGNTLIFIIVILFMYLSNPGGDGVNTKYEYNQLQQLKQQFSAEYESFKGMNHSTNFKNITGFKLSYHDIVEDPSRNATYPIDGKEYNKWEANENYLVLPDEVTNRILTEVWDHEEVSQSYPPNITAALYGKVSLVSNNKFKPVRMGIPNFYQPPTDFAQDEPPSGEYYLTPDNMPKYGEEHNVTFAKGKMDVSISPLDEVWPTWRHSDTSRGKRFNSQENKWKLLRLGLAFYDNKENEKHSIEALAVYDVQRGQILFMSQSAKFHSIFALPHYMTVLGDASRYEEVATLIDEYWKASEYSDTLTMQDLQGWHDVANYRCEYIGYLQLKEWDKYNKDEIKMIDDELYWPIGRPVNMSDIPNVEIAKGLLFSPDCGVELNLENVAGPRYELHVRGIRKHLLFGCLLFAAQIYLFILQMHYTNTPSAVNRISYWCLAMMNMVDGLLSALYYLAAMYKRELYLPLTVSSFACFILAAIFEIRYMISVYASQVNERGVSFWTLLRGGVADNRPPIAVIPDEAAISGSLYGRFIFTLFSSICIALSSFTWSKGIRTVFEYFCLTVLNSYWIPQIFRNAVKGNEPRHLRTRLNSGVSNRNNSNRMPLLWKFIIGTTIIRIAPVIYLFTYSSNMFRHHKDTRFAILLSLWLLLQIAVLYSQDMFGARWFLLKHVIPEVYSYHKTVISSDLLEHGSGGNYSVDCAICMSEVAVYVEDIPETHKANINEYMAAPCSHIFHTECLENWMSYKLQCPVCRAPLPPL